MEDTLTDIGVVGLSKVLENARKLAGIVTYIPTYPGMNEKQLQIVPASGQE